jgi:hypothetical protein
VIVDPKFPRSDELKPELEQFVRRLRKACPGCEILPPVLIPQFDLAPNPSEAECEANRIAREALLKALPLARRNTAQILARIRANFREDFKQLVDPVFAHILPHYNNLRNAEEQIASKILEEIVGSDRQLISGIRLQMLAFTVSSAPILFFPYRTFLGLLALTAGAWDRLVLGLSGSVPSLALAAFQGLQNIRQFRNRGPSQRERLKERIHRLAQAELETPARIFNRAVQQSGGRFSQEEQPTEKVLRVQGLDWMMDESFRSMQARIEEHRPSSRTVSVCGFLATGIFVALVSGPIVAIYRHFLRSWSQAFTIAGATWAQFPTPSGGMIFTSMLLVAIPVFALALIALSLAVRKARIVRCAEAIRHSHEQLRKTAAQDRRIWIDSDDPFREAFASLLAFTFVEEDSNSKENKE